jgi:hypothetical protein
MKICIWAIWISFLLPAVAFACKPCDGTLDFKQTVLKSDLIILGQKSGEDPSSTLLDQPSWIEVKVEKVFKGQPDLAAIKVHSYSGMCPYGIQLVDGQNYLIFLSQLPETKTGVAQYSAVNDGCAVKTYLVDDETVLITDVSGLTPAGINALLKSGKTFNTKSLGEIKRDIEGN